MLRLRFEEERTQRKIGQRIGVSQMQTSRIIRDSIARLRTAAGERAGRARRDLGASTPDAPPSCTQNARSNSTQAAGEDLKDA